MRKDEIQVGKTYTNGKGKRKVAKIIPAGPYSDAVVFHWLSGAKPAFPYIGYTFITQLTTFARWAKSEVKEGEDA